MDVMDVEGSGAEILVACLVRAGIDVIFGVPGDTGMFFYDALYRRRDQIRHVLARDERSSAAMADAYARCTNRVGVVEASSGGGATYLASGLGEAYAASVPILAITSDIRQSSAGTSAITEIDQDKLFSAVTKWRRSVTRAADIPALVAEALEACTSGRPAPAALIVPEDVLEDRTRVAIAPMADRLPGARPSVDAAAARVVAAALQAAERPAVVAGSGVHLAQAYGALSDLAGRMGVPVATTIQGKGAVAEGSEWSLGVVGANGARPYANAYLESADVVLFIGTRANATDTNSFRSPPRQGTTIFHLDVDPARVGRNYPGSTALVGDAAAVIDQILCGAQPGSSARRRRLLAEIEGARCMWRGTPASPSQFSASRDGRPVLMPAAVLRAIADVTAGQALLIADPGTPTPYVAAYWETRESGRTVIIPRGHGAMGYAIPAAIGAALGRQDMPIIALTTDGSFGMACGELETAHRLQLPITYIHFRNNCFGWIKMLQHLYQEDRYFGVDFGASDATMVARGFGLEATSVADLDGFTDALRTALRPGARSTFIDVPVPEEREVIPAVPPWLDTVAGKAGRPSY